MIEGLQGYAEYKKSSIPWTYLFSKRAVSCEISLIRYFYKPPVLRSLEEIRADILALEQETEGLLGEIVGDKALSV